MPVPISNTPVNIPFPSPIGTTGTAGIAGQLTPYRRGTPPTTHSPSGRLGQIPHNAAVLIINDTDNTLLFAWADGKDEWTMVPGERYVAPVPQYATMLQWTITSQNPTPNHPQELLHLWVCQGYEIDDHPEEIYPPETIAHWKKFGLFQQ